MARRRLSWGRMEAPDDPLRFDIPLAQPRTSNPQRTTPDTGWTMREDPFASPEEESGPPFIDNFVYQSADGGTYKTAQAGPSSASLISSVYRRNSDPDTQHEDDEAALTSNMSHPRTSGGWGESMELDTERSAATTRKRTRRYSATPSPLRKTGNRLMTISRNLRRASLRVVNMAGVGLDQHVRLADVDDNEYHEDDEDGEEKDYDVLEASELTKFPPIRGRTLGFMGPNNKIRLAMYRFLLLR